MHEKKLITIGEASKILNLSIQTLRRWDKSGRLIAYKTKGGQRRYIKSEIQILASGTIFKLAYKWTSTKTPPILNSDIHCQDRSIFEGRLQHLNKVMTQAKIDNDSNSLITTAVGEIGNNSFDHNLGKWPDVPGILFSYDLSKGTIILADRGLGILTTLSRVKPDLTKHTDALRVAFTEIITGRAPEKRGNGLKYIMKIVKMGIISIKFQTGDAILEIDAGDTDFKIKKTNTPIRGTVALIKFKTI